MRLQLVLCLLSFQYSIHAAFTYNDRVCWRRNCIVRTDAGTICFKTYDNGVKPEECADYFLKNLTRTHTTSAIDRSILYYDEKGHVLGAAMWTVSPAVAGSVFVCMTGQQVDNPKRYITVCREAHGDDDMDIASAHTRECVSDQKPRYMRDGCFSLGKPARGDDEHKEWYEQRVVAGFFFVLSALLALGSVYLWGGKAVRAVQDRLPIRLVGHGAAVQAITISDQQHANGVPRPETFELTDHASAARLPGPVGEEVNRD